MKDTVAIIATRKVRGGWAREGQRKDMPAAHARVLVLLGQAVYAPTAEQTDGKRSARYARRDMQPTQSAPAPAGMDVVTKYGRWRDATSAAGQSNDDEASQP